MSRLVSVRLAYTCLHKMNTRVGRVNAGRSTSIAMTQFADLNDYCLLAVLDLLPAEQLFKMLGVDKRMNRLAAEKIWVKIRAISLNESDNSWSKCVHSNAITSQDQVLIPKSLIFENWIKSCSLLESVKKSRFLSLLVRCDCVKSIDFGDWFDLTGDFLYEVFRRCPELECLKVGDSIVEDDIWNQLLNQNGHRIVHLARHCAFADWEGAQLLVTVAEKCLNIKQLDWTTRCYLTSNLLAAFKMLPSTGCWVTFKSQNSPDLEENVIFEGVIDVVDELDIEFLNWPSTSRRAERLESLKFQTLNLDYFKDLVFGVEFVKLKKLDVKIFRGNIDCLVASRFPQLEEFCFNAGGDFTEDDYDSLFKRMPNVKKLDVVCCERWPPNRAPLLPGSAIYLLKKLEAIHLDVKCEILIWPIEEFLQQIEQYVDESNSLKKLSVVLWHRDDEWNKKIENEITRIKVKQNRVEIDFVIKTKHL